MGRHVVQPLCVVVCPGHDFAVAYYYCPDGDFPLFRGGAGFAQGFAHVILVIVVENAHGSFLLKMSGLAGRFLKWV